MSIKSVLEQKPGFKKSNKFTITSECELEIEDKTLFMSRTGKIPLWVINPNYTTFKKTNIKAFIGFTLGLTPCVFSIIDILNESHGDIRNVVLIITFSLIFSLMCLSNFMKSLGERIFFNNKENGQQIFSLSRTTKNQDEVDEFIALLIRDVKAFKYPSSLPMEQKNEIFQRHLDFLFSEGVLTNEEVQTIIDRINHKNQQTAEVIKFV